MRPTSVNAPGILGYAAAVVVSCVVFALLLALPGLLYYDVPTGFGILLIYVPAGAVAALVVGSPVWIGGVVLVHLVLSRVRCQVAHVLVAGFVGSLLVLPLVRTTPLHRLGAGGPWYLVLAVGLAAAVGRTAVVPLVGSRRELAAAGRLTGTARW